MLLLHRFNKANNQLHTEKSWTDFHPKTEIHMQTCKHSAQEMHIKNAHMSLVLFSQ